MPEDIPKAVMILLWLLIGVIVFGTLLMKSSAGLAIIFAVLFYGVPVMWYTSRKQEE